MQNVVLSIRVNNAYDNNRDTILIDVHVNIAVNANIVTSAIIKTVLHFASDNV